MLLISYIVSSNNAAASLFPEPSQILLHGTLPPKSPESPIPSIETSKYDAKLRSAVPESTASASNAFPNHERKVEVSSEYSIRIAEITVSPNTHCHTLHPSSFVL